MQRRNQRQTISPFTEQTPTLDNYWRAIILFGRNTASYKFALSKTILHLTKRNLKKNEIKIEDLALPFALEICEHLKNSDTQATAKTSRFLDYCRKHNSKEISKEELQAATIKLGFNNVITAFHTVNNGIIPIQFFEDCRSTKSSIVLTDSFGELLELTQSASLIDETESRWNLVETAWNLGISRTLISFDPDKELLHARDKNNRRKNVTSSRGALNGYQKGKCFFCFGQISITTGTKDIAHVDHFFPHLLKGKGIADPINGVWNLVLSCAQCNGAEEKGSKVPSLSLLERLNTRNEYLISSHHPLRETLILQTGKDVRARKIKLQSAYNGAREKLIHSWEPKKKGDARF
jgi:hypothetical protein